MRRIEREAATDAALAAEIARHRALKARLSAHYAPVLEEAVLVRLRSPFTANDKIDTTLAVRRNARARFSGIYWGAIAASLLIVLTIGLRPLLRGAPKPKSKSTT